MINESRPGEQSLYSGGVGVNFGAGVGGGDELEPITPAKICVTLMLRNYVLTLRNADSNDSDFPDDASSLTGSSKTLTSRQRKNFCLLAIKLIQGVDRSLVDLADVVFPSREDCVTPALFGAWKKDMATVVEEGVGSLMDLALSLEKMVSNEVQVPLLHRSSVVGLFLRRIVLGFERLNFSDVARLHRLFQSYYDFGKTALLRDEESSNLSGGCHLDMSSFSAEVANINRRKLDTTAAAGVKLTRKQAELYISNQVELLQKAEVHAHAPEKMAEIVAKILEHNPDLAEAHFLSYLNCMRVNEYCGAMDHVNRGFVSPAATAAATTAGDVLEVLTPVEDLNKGFRYAALNLAAMHARFNHRREATSALREAIMMAQEANDHVCLQHALSWLYQIQPKDRMTLIERCVTKSSEFNLSYLTSLGIQAMSQFAAIVGHGPAAVIEMLSRSDVLNCQHSIVELVTSSYSQKASLWTLYGKTHVSCVVSQLLLHLDTSDRTRDGIFVTSEATAISLSNLARHLHDNGHEKACDKVLLLAKYVTI